MVSSRFLSAFIVAENVVSRVFYDSDMSP
jgi:hypothetical protein